MVFWLTSTNYADEPKTSAAAADSEETEGEIPASGVKVKPPRVVVLRMREGLQFDPPRFSAQPNEPLTLQIENADSTGMTHNFLLLKAGRREEIVNEAAALGEQGPAQNFIPKTSEILISSPVLPAEGVNRVRVKMPSEPGIYPYVCTFPGHGMVMYGAAYVGVPVPELAEDKNVPPTSLHAAIAGAGRRPFVQRIFMPDCGPAAIAVALMGNQNYCWDAGECRLRYAWQGSFIDAGEHWSGKGGQLATVSAQPWWRAEQTELALHVDAKRKDTPAVKFLGYALNPQGPEFHYRVGATEVFEQIVPATGGPGLTIQFRIPAARADVFYDVPPLEKDRWKSSVGSWDGATLHVTAAQAKQFALTFTTPLCRP
jgi:hypothetical protein